MVVCPLTGGRAATQLPNSLLIPFREDHAKEVFPQKAAHRSHKKVRRGDTPVALRSIGLIHLLVTPLAVDRRCLRPGLGELRLGVEVGAGGVLVIARRRAPRLLDVEDPTRQHQCRPARTGTRWSQTRGGRVVP